MRSLTCIFVVLLSSGLVSSPRQSRIAVTGVVTEESTGLALEQVVVVATPLLATGSSAKATTDDAGQFRIADLPNGHYRISATRAGYVEARPAHLRLLREPGVWVQVIEGKPSQTVELSMVRAGIITGTVLAENGRPFLVREQPSRVTLLTYLYDRMGDRRLARAPGVSYSPAGPAVDINDRGEYRFYDLPPGDYYIATTTLYTDTGDFVAPVYYPGTSDEGLAEPISVEAGGNVRLPTLLVRSVKTSQVRFRTVMPDDLRIEGSRIVYVDYGNVSSFEFAANGKMITRRVIPGHYDFLMAVGSPTDDTLLYGAASVDVSDRDLETDVILKRGYHIDGSLTIEDGAGHQTVLEKTDPSTGVRCHLLTRNNSFQKARSCVGEDFAPGLYRLDVTDLPQDAFVSSVRINGIDALGRDIELDSDSTLTIEIHVPGGSIEGTVIDQRGEAVPNAVAALVPDSPLRHAPYLYRSVTSDVNGHFELRGIRPGAYHIFSWYELEGEAYRNEDFLRDFEERGGIAVRIEERRVSLDVPVLCRQSDSDCAPATGAK